MNKNPLLILEELGQSIWLDFLSRSSLDTGELKGYIDNDGVDGITSNPSIFEKAIDGTRDYEGSIRSLAGAGKTSLEIYEAITLEDIRRAADLFRPVYERARTLDGFVSLEVSPRLAHDTAATVAEARRLWSEIGRPNAFIKVPATKEGIPAIRQLIGEGININITLLFGLPRYREVADAYLGGLETLVQQGRPIQGVRSVASFFLSRIDVLVDPTLEKQKQAGGPNAALAGSLEGKAAIASARVAYQIYKEIFATVRFQTLAQKGAQVQRLLWASTSTKNPAYSDVLYVDALIGKDTINTIPVETLHAYRDHGNPALRLEENVHAAYQNLDDLARVGIDIDQATQQLEDEGVEKFIAAFDKVLAAIEGKRREARP